MPPARAAHANQRTRQRSSTGRGSATKQPAAALGLSKLIGGIEDSLGSAVALGYAIELMAFGLGSLGEDYSTALVTVAQSLLEHLAAARKACRTVLDENTAAGRVSDDSAIRAPGKT